MNRLRIFQNPEEIAERLAKDIYMWTHEKKNEDELFSIALSGGSTPGILFDYLLKEYHSLMDWTRLKLFWGDERMVEPGHAESNYGDAYNRLIKHVEIPEANVHRMKGEKDPGEAAAEYEQELMEHLNKDNGVPLFDLVILGMGEDGHTASIFPDQMNLLNSPQLCEIAEHPVSKQKRITLTGAVLTHAKRVVFLVTGNKKASVVKQIMESEKSAEEYPAAWIHYHSKSVWYLDDKAAKLISK